MLKNEHCRKQCSFLKVYVRFYAAVLSNNAVFFSSSRNAKLQTKAATLNRVTNINGTKAVVCQIRIIPPNIFAHKKSPVSKYVRLDKFPAIDTFANLCEILDVSSDDILGLKK